MNKNKKGFTLIELLAVVAVLAVIALVVISSITSTVDETKNKITEINKTQIKDAANVLANELLLCDNATSNFIIDNSSCADIKKEINSENGYSTDVTIEELVTNNYLSDKYNNCNGIINITIKNDYSTSINLDEESYCA